MVKVVPESIVAGELALTLNNLTLLRELSDVRRPQFVLVVDFPRLVTNGERNNLNVIDTQDLKNAKKHLWTPNIRAPHRD